MNIIFFQNFEYKKKGSIALAKSKLEKFAYVPPDLCTIMLQKEFSYTYLLLIYCNFEVHTSIFITSMLIESAVGLTVEFSVDILCNVKI